MISAPTSDATRNSRAPRQTEFVLLQCCSLEGWRSPRLVPPPTLENLNVWEKGITRDTCAPHPPSLDKWNNYGAAQTPASRLYGIQLSADCSRLRYAVVARNPRVISRCCRRCVMVHLNCVFHHLFTLLREQVLLRISADATDTYL